MAGSSTNALHADEHLDKYSDVAPAISLSNIFKYPADPVELDYFMKHEHTYSRESQPNVSRCEAVLTSLCGGHAVAYASGISALHAVVMAVNPKRVFVDHSYYGYRVLLNKLQKNGYIEVLSLKDMSTRLEKGDLVHIECPTSPWGEAVDIENYTKIVHEKGGVICVDATTGPPPLLQPFNVGADIVVHSGSKYLGGHSDVLAGVVVTQSEEFKKQLVTERIEFGSILPTFQAWLLLRSLRTLSLRVKQQAKNADLLVKYLSENQHRFSKLAKVYHTSLQAQEHAFVKQLMPNGGPATFSIETTDEESARELPNKLNLFVHTTSMGGVESSVEWRALSESTVSRCLIRISVGIEDIEDLCADFSQAFEAIA